MHDSKYDLPGGRWQRTDLGRRGQIVFVYRAPCWLSSAVLPAVRAGKQTAPAAFRTRLMPGKFWKRRTDDGLHNLQLQTNLNVSGREQIQEYDFGLILEYNPLWVVTYCRLNISCVGNLEPQTLFY